MYPVFQPQSHIELPPATYLPLPLLLASLLFLFILQPLIPCSAVLGTLGSVLQASAEPQVAGVP